MRSQEKKKTHRLARQAQTGRAEFRASSMLIDDSISAQRSKGVVVQKRAPPRLFETRRNKWTIQSARAHSAQSSESSKG